MHSFGYRANALLTFAVTILALMCAIASLSDNLNTPSPSAQIEILNINWFQKQPHGNDEVSLTLNITADLQSLFTWNTKQLFIFVAAEYETPKNALNQVSLWDAIIPAKEFAKFSIHTSNKYRFIDQGHNLRGKEFNLTLHWHVMPKTGKMFADKIVMSGYRLPEDYRYLDYDLLAAFRPLIYLVAALLLFYVYLSGEIFVWQAVGFVGFYLFFVGIVFWTDLGSSRNEKRSEMEMSEDCEIGQVKGLEQLEKNDASGFAQVYGKGGDDHEMYLKLASAGS